MHGQRSVTVGFARFVIVGSDFLGLGLVEESSGGREGQSLNKLLEKGVFLVILGFLDRVRATVLFFCKLCSQLNFVVLNVDLTVDNLAVEVDVGHSHSVLSNGSSLVGADARCGAKSLDILKVLHEHLLGGHALGSEGKRHSDSSEKTFGNVSDNDTNSEDEHIDGTILDYQETVSEEGNTEDDSHDRDQDNESLNFVRKRSLLGLGR